MLPTYKESYTSYMTPSQNTQIHIYRKKKVKSAYERESIRQKILGFLLVAVGVGSCICMPEDCGGGIMAIGLGILRIAY